MTSVWRRRWGWGGGGLVLLAVLLLVGSVVALRLRHAAELQPVTASGH